MTRRAWRNHSGRARGDAVALRGTGGEISFPKKIPARGGRGGAAGFSLERTGRRFAGNGNRGDPGCGAALHRGGIDCRDGRGRARNGRGGRGAAGDGHDQGNGRRQNHFAHGGSRKLWSVQTPQTFRVAVIRRAIAAAREKNLVLTDDTAACELIGQPVQLVKIHRRRIPR
jgi:hypothetical protein